MQRNRLLAVATAAVASTMALSLSPYGGSEAQWREEATASAVGPSSDTFALTAKDAESPAPAWSGSGPISNSPRINLTNQATAHSSWINVRTTRLARVVQDAASAALMGKAKIDYRSGDTSCTNTTSLLWNARAYGTVTDGATYTRAPQDKVTGATLTPGQTRVLCPTISLNYTGANAHRDALLNHAGRAIDITTKLNQRSEAPATWASPDKTVTSRYRLAMPAPVKPASGDVCRKTFSNGNPSGAGLFGGFFWGWPNAGTDDATTTPAMAGGWELFRRDLDTQEWVSWQPDVNPGSDRKRAGVNSNDISDDGQSRRAVREFILRGYPFAGDKTRYVESDWIARAHETFLGAWACDSPLPNPAASAGPHNMP